MNVLIWGAGDGGLRTQTMLQPHIKISAFIDIDKNKIGKKLNGIPIISENEIVNYSFDYIIIANMYKSEITEILINKYSVPSQKILDIYQEGLIDVRLGTLKALCQEIKEKNVAGSVAELGVYRGEFAKHINYFFDDRSLYLFDTFSGFDERDIIIEEKLQFSNSSEGEYCNESIQLVLNKMSYKQNCIIKKVYFPESAVDVDDVFCFVSIDVDLYQPIYEGLIYFYDRLVKGGYIMVHDYNSTRFDGVKKAVRQFAEEKGINYYPVMDLGGSVILCK